MDINKVVSRAVILRGLKINYVCMFYQLTEKP